MAKVQTVGYLQLNTLGIIGLMQWFDKHKHDRKMMGALWLEGSDYEEQDKHTATTQYKYKLTSYDMMVSPIAPAVLFANLTEDTEEETFSFENFDFSDFSDFTSLFGKTKDGGNRSDVDNVSSLSLLWELQQRKPRGASLQSNKS